MIDKNNRVLDVINKIHFRLMYLFFLFVDTLLAGVDSLVHICLNQLKNKGGN